MSKIESLSVSLSFGISEGSIVIYLISFSFENPKTAFNRLIRELGERVKTVRKTKSDLRLSKGIFTNNQRAYIFIWVYMMIGSFA